MDSDSLRIRLDVSKFFVIEHAMAAWNSRIRDGSRVCRLRYVRQPIKHPWSLRLVCDTACRVHGARAPRLVSSHQQSGRSGGKFSPGAGMNPFQRSIDPNSMRDAVSDAMSSLQTATPSMTRLCFGNITSLYSVTHDAHGNAGMMGEGSSCQVFRAVRKLDGSPFAIKRLSSKISKKVVLSELRILRQVDHPSVVLLHDTVVDDVDCSVHFVLELCSGGDLFDNLKQRGHFSEPSAARMLVKMFRAVEHLHALRIAHRDLKLENWVMRKSLTSGKGDLEPVLIDFGLSHQLASPEERMTECLGTSFYVAPETVRKSYGLTCDVWALGVITYMILSGKTPFGGKDDQEVLHRILHCNVTFISPVWGTVSSQAKEFICSLLRKNPTERFTIRQAFEHPWLIENAGYAPLGSPSHSAARYKAAQELLARMQTFLELPTFLKMAMALWASDGPMRTDPHVCNMFDLLSANTSGIIEASVREIYIDGREKRSFEDAFEKLSDLSGSRMSFSAFCALYLRPVDLPTFQGHPTTMNRIFQVLSTGDEVITAASLRACLGTVVVHSDSSHKKRLRRGRSQGSAAFIAILEEVVEDSMGRLSRDMFRDVLLGKKITQDAKSTSVKSTSEMGEDEEEESKEDESMEDAMDDQLTVENPEVSSGSRMF
ncbi:Protein kinase, putative [Hondaea fermentalgiana]|uniref:Protein kinase, putative n=1 Tax=Hondaea fermentalgiana TaxID=2315210 RepID=A0A2R5G4D8_9STRA|nr:Protein kinase, putative [Hondaea fermentalgiana]|eukprot:GBG25886.1 Protein kinase, putative [Hondaea fermentalgiana]